MKLNIKKIFSKQYQKYWLIALIAIIVIVPCVLIPITLTLNKRDFVLANFKSYMSPKVQTILRNKYDLSFDSFENAEDAKKLLKQNASDIINTTSYELVDWIQSGLVKKIDWKQFNIQGINDANEALKLFINPVQKILVGYDLNQNNKYYPQDQEDNLLNYGIPYFVQDLVFCYRGNKINNLNQNCSWFDVVNNLLNNFKEVNNKPNLIALNDARTIYSIARILQTNNSINPQNNATLDDLNNTYNYLIKYLKNLGNPPITFSDSNAVLNALANNSMKGAIMFNGDAIFSSFGGDEHCKISSNDFHYIKPPKTLIALDLFCINNKISNDNLNKSYQILNDLCLQFNPNNVNQNLSYLNFDYVNYTTPLLSMYNYLTDSNTNYFAPWQLKLFKIDQNNFLYELPISNIIKSNFSFAWINFKNSL